MEHILPTITRRKISKILIKENESKDQIKWISEKNLRDGGIERFIANNRKESKENLGAKEPNPFNFMTLRENPR